MIIYFVRHGESEANKNNFHHTPEVPLSELGLQQAHNAAKRFKNIKIDLIYSSPLMRARQTAEIINKKIKAPIEYWDDLSEMRQPSEIRGKRVDDEEVLKIKQLITQNSNTLNYHYSDEENFNDINERTKNVLKHLESKHKDQTILCVSHSIYIKTIVGKIIFGDEFNKEIFDNLQTHMWMQNTGITICEKHPKYGWQLNTWNDSLHI